MLIFHTVNGKKIFIIFIVILAIILTLSTQKERLVRHLNGVNKDVKYLNNDMTGLLEEEVINIVQKTKTDFNIKPIDAEIDKENSQGVIPHAFGYSLDINATVNEIMVSEIGNVVEPQLKVIEPEISLNDFLHPVYRGNPKKNQVAFIVNVAWGGEFIPELLEIFNQYGVNSTFFIVGRWADKNQELVTQIFKHGHEIGSHGYDDSIILKGLNERDVQKDLEASKKAVEDIIGSKVMFFSPHKGEYDELTLKTCSMMDMRMIMWTLDTADWMKPGVEKMLDRTVNKIFNGAIILMHPTEETLTYLREALPLLINNGFEIVTIAELLNPDWLKLY